MPVGGIYEIGSRGERLLADYLRARGRTVALSDRKTFDIIVDGRYAEVKTSDGPYSRLGFIGLTDAQYRELRQGTPFSIFVVCNAKLPDELEVIEFDAAELLRVEPKIESTYYWYRSHLDKCRHSSDGKRAAHAQEIEQPSPRYAAPATQIAESQSAPNECIVYVRRLAANNDADLYIRFAREDVERLNLSDRQPVRVGLGGGIVIDGSIRTTSSSPWLSPASGSSNADISALIAAAGLKHGDDRPAIISAL